jgi:hypothetical protein
MNTVRGNSNGSFEEAGLLLMCGRITGMLPERQTFRSGESLIRKYPDRISGDSTARPFIG